MANEEVKNEAAAAAVKTEEKQQAAVPLEQSITKLAKFGGFDFLSGVVDGSDNMNPGNEAKKDIFMEEDMYKAQRADLKKKIELWLNLLATESVSDMVDKGLERSESAEKLLKANLKKVLDKTKELESSYRSLHLFYKNTESTRLDNVHIMNASMAQLTDLDTPDFIEHVSAKMKNVFDRLDMRQNYSLLVVPGYLKSQAVVNKWAKIAYENKAMLVTDFRNLAKPEDVLSMFNDSNLTSGDAYKANVLMTCNYIVGRGKNKDVGEKDDIYVPGSAALAGKLYCTKMSQPVAGKTFGNLDEVQAVRFDMQKATISKLEDVGLVPLVGEWGSVMPFSSKTLFTGDNLGMKTYSVVRVFDFIAKVMSDFLNRRAFELWNAKMEGNLRKQIIKFLDGIKGHDKLIEKFEILRFERDEEQRDHIYLDIHITPFFPAKSFLVTLDGYDGKDGEEWKSELKEQAAAAGKK